MSPSASLCLLLICWLSTSYGYDRLSTMNINHAAKAASIDRYMNSIFHNTAATNNISAASFSVNVLDYGAVGDAKTDNTAAFNKALEASNGGYVIVPAGKYLFKSTITIPSGVTLLGTYSIVPQHKAESNSLSGINWNDLSDGSILGYDGPTSTQFIKMKESSFIKGFSIYYPKQVCNVATPTRYASTISIQGPNVAILDIELINSYIGITMDSSSARHFISRVEGGPIYVGLSIDQCHDIGRTENVHFKSGWSCALAAYNSNNIKDTTVHWSAMYGISFLVGDTDWEFMFNTFSWGYAVGYNFVETSSGSPNGNFLGIASDANTNASIKVDSTKKWGIAITNGEFVARANDKAGIDYNADVTSVVVSKGNEGNVHLSNCIFFGAAEYIARIYGDSSTSFENCEFHEWNATNPAIYAEAGTVRVIGNNFYKQGAKTKHIQFKSGTQKGIVVGNSFGDTIEIDVDSGVPYAQSANL